MRLSPRISFKSVARGQNRLETGKSECGELWTGGLGRQLSVSTAHPLLAFDSTVFCELGSESLQHHLSRCANRLGFTTWHFIARAWQRSASPFHDFVKLAISKKLCRLQGRELFSHRRGNQLIYSCPVFLALSFHCFLRERGNRKGYVIDCVTFLSSASTEATSGPASNMITLVFFGPSECL